MYSSDMLSNSFNGDVTSRVTRKVDHLPVTGAGSEWGSDTFIYRSCKLFNDCLRRCPSHSWLFQKQGATLLHGLSDLLSSTRDFDFMSIWSFTVIL